MAVCRVQHVWELRHCVPVGGHRKVLQPVTHTELVSFIGFITCWLVYFLFVYPLPQRDGFFLSLSLSPIDRNAELMFSVNVKTGLLAASCELVNKPVILARLGVLQLAVHLLARRRMQLTCKRLH